MSFNPGRLGDGGGTGGGGGDTGSVDNSGDQQQQQQRDDEDPPRTVEGPGGVEVTLGEGQRAGADARPSDSGGSSGGGSSSSGGGGAGVGTGPLDPGSVGTGTPGGAVDPAQPEPDPSGGTSSPSPSDPRTGSRGSTGGLDPGGAGGTGDDTGGGGGGGQDTLAGDPNSELVVDPDTFESGDTSQIDEPGQVSNRTGQTTVDQDVSQGLDSAPDVVGAAAAGEERLADLPGAGAVGDIARGAGGRIRGTGEFVDNVTDPVTDPVVGASERGREALVDQSIDPAFDALNAGERVDDAIGGRVGDLAAGAAEFTATGARGLGVAVTETTVGLPANLADTAQTGAEAAEFVGENVSSEGIVRGTAQSTDAATDVGAAAAGAAAEQARENPAGFLGNLTGQALGGFATGTAGARALERGTSAARVAAETRRSDVDVDIEDVTSDRGAQGELPEFETSPDAPTSEAVAEIRERARDQPDQLQDRLGDEVMLRSESQRLDADFEAGQGSFELPGLFASPDLSPLRLDTGAGRGGVSLRRPRLFRAERASAFETDDIRGMPDDAAGSGRIEGPDGELRPDPDAPGSQFLNERAEPGTAFVRPTGDRTTELEGIFAPGTRFERVETGRLDTGGRPGTIDLFRRADRDGGADAPDAGDTVRFDEIASSRRGGVPDDAPATPGFGGSGPGTTGPTGGTPDRPTPPDIRGSPFDGARDPFSPETDSGDFTGGGGGGSSGGPTGSGGPTTTGNPFDPPTREPPTREPPTSGPPSGGPPTPGPPTTGTPFDPPTSGPPTSDPPTSGPPTSGPPRDTPPSDPPTSGPPTSDPPTSGPPTSGPPTSGPPSSGPPSSGPPSFGPPSSGPPGGGIPGVPGSDPTRTRPRFDSDPDDRDDEPALPIGPTGQDFTNPVVGGAGFLFGGGGGGGRDQAAEPTGLFGEPARESDPFAGGGPFGQLGGFGGTGGGRTGDDESTAGFGLFLG